MRLMGKIVFCCLIGNTTVFGRTRAGQKQRVFVRGCPFHIDSKARVVCLCSRSSATKTVLLPVRRQNTIFCISPHKMLLIFFESSAKICVLLSRWQHDVCGRARARQNSVYMPVNHLTLIIWLFC